MADKSVAVVSVKNEDREVLIKEIARLILENTFSNELESVLFELREKLKNAR